MLSQLNNWIVGTMDYLLGWLLRFPSDVQIFAVAIASALILTAVRFWTSDQDLLGRCHRDKMQLKALLRAAKSQADHASIKRHRTTLGMIAMKHLRQEVRPVLASLVPIILLATWALSRLEFHPLKAGEAVEFTAYFPISAVGKMAHIVPSDSITAPAGWIQEITAVTGQGPAHGMATWHLASEARDQPESLQVRYDKRTFEHPFRAGSSTYEAPVINHDEHLLATELKLRPVKLFGLIPGIPAISFPAWLVAYLIIIIPFTYLLKKVLHVH
jgi:uncharacterized membrane protein (DUF106 family)